MTTPRDLTKTWEMDDTGLGSHALSALNHYVHQLNRCANISGLIAENKARAPRATRDDRYLAMHEGDLRHIRDYILPDAEEEARSLVPSLDLRLRVKEDPKPPTDPPLRIDPFGNIVSSWWNEPPIPAFTEEEFAQLIGAFRERNEP